jgi:peptidoglycan/LPS O-acetylase OafA/YrhL
MSDAPAPARIPYQPSLDGLRGVAVLAVLFFHGGFAWARGGFLGVSTFFTLSGFLITSLLLAEHRDEGRIDLTHFWERRFRRLLPASLLTLLLVIVLAATVLPEARPGLTGDVLSALFYVANWHFLLAGTSYADLFSLPSPVLHFWSLAIEEQFYLLFPLVAWWVLRRFRGATSALLRVILAGFAASTLVLVVASLLGASSFAYYATPARAAELLAGAALACLVWMGRLRPLHPASVEWDAPPVEARPWWAEEHWSQTAPVPVRTLARPAPPRLTERVRAATPTQWPAAAGLVAIAVLVPLYALTDRGERWLSLGGFPLVSVFSCLLIAGALGTGPVQRGLSFEPLRQLGRISYGVYLFHWPIFVWLTADVVGFGGWRLFTVRVGLTLVLAVASFHLVETPIRTGRVLGRREGVIVAPAGALGVVALLLVTTPGATAKGADQFSAARALFESVPTAVAPATTAAAAQEATPPIALPAGPEGAAAPPPPTTALPPPPVKVAVFGDSTALMTSAGLLQWGQATGRIEVTAAGAFVGCGISREGTRRYHWEGEKPVPEGCKTWPTSWPAVLREQGTQVAVVQAGPWDAADRRLPGDDRWHHLGDPVYDAYVKAEMRAAVETLESTGAVVVWLTAPVIELGRNEEPPPREPYQASEPERMLRYNRLLWEVAVEHPTLRLVDLAGYLRALPGGELDPALRPDGVHFTVESSHVVADWLAPAILAAAGLAPPTPPAG